MSTGTIEAPREREALARREDVTPAGEFREPPVRVDVSLEPATYVGMSEAPVTEEQAAILGRALTPEDIDLRPDGQVYMGHAKLRQRLNEAFRPGGWAIRRLSSVDVNVATEAQADRGAEFVMSAEFALYVGGRFVSAARGEQKYQDNGEMTYGDAAEGMKSNAISRCCKDLGIALDLWDRTFADRWRNEHGVKVWGENRSGQRWRKPQWRRIDGLPLYGETGPTDDSPNQDRYVYPDGGRRRQTSDRDADQRREERREPPRQEQRRSEPPPREREPGDDDEPVRDRRDEPRREAPRENGDRPRGGRTISDAQQKRLYAIAKNEGGLDRDGYADLLRRWDYGSDRDIRVADYDAIVAAARTGGR